MAQSIKPRINGEGSLGLETRQWGDVQTKKINGIDFIDKNLGTGENDLNNIQTKKINGKNVSDILFQGDAITEEETIALIIALS